jgi:subtilisin family serine protease
VFVSLIVDHSISSTGDAEDLYRWSNTGACIDIFAPGVDIFAACGGAKRCEEVNDKAYTWASGTSMAVPHVAAAAALYLELHPQATPAEVHEALVNGASSGLLDVAAMLEGTPNRYLYSGAMYVKGEEAHTEAFAGREGEQVVVSADGPNDFGATDRRTGVGAAIGGGVGHVSPGGKSSSSDAAPDGPKLIAANGKA